MNLPKNIIIDPIPPTIVYLIGFDHTSSKPSLAAVQKFVPLKAI